jgi:hypothetical protein
MSEVYQELSTRAHKLSRNSKGEFVKGHSLWLGHFGALAPAWRGGSSFPPYVPEFNDALKEQIRQRDNYHCQICEVNQISLDAKLDVHHIDLNKRNNDPSNLIAYCGTCHMKLHWRLWKSQPS